MSDNKNYGQSFGQSLLGGIVGNVLGAATNEWQNQRNYERQVQAQKDAESRQNLEWWKRQQHLENYQSPANMARLIREAGGNPLALFSQGYSPNPANPVSPGLSSPNIGSTTANPVLDPLTTAEIDLMKAQAEKLRSDIDVNKSDISLNSAYEEFTKQQTLSEEQLTRLRSIEADVQEAVKDDNIESYKVSLMKLYAEVANIDANSDLARQTQQNLIITSLIEDYKLKHILPAELRQIDATTFNLNAGGVNYLAQANLSQTQANEIQALLPYKQQKLSAETWQIFNDVTRDWAKFGLENERLEIEKALKDIEEGKWDLQKVKSFTNAGLITIGALLVATGAGAPLGYSLMAVGGVGGLIKKY